MLLDEDDFRSFSQALELGHVLLLSQLHVTVSPYSEICFCDILFLIHQYGSHRFLFNLLQCVLVSTHNVLWILIHMRVSPFLFSLGHNWVLVGFIGYLCCFQRYQNPIHTSNYLCRKFSVVVEVTHLPSGILILQISSQLLTRYDRLAVYRRG